MKKVLALLKKYIVVIIITLVIAIGGFWSWKLIFSNNLISDKKASNTKINEEDYDILSNGTYGCEFMYNGKSLNDTEVMKTFIQKLATYDDSIAIDKIDFSDFKEEKDDLFYILEKAYIVKENNIVKLNINNWSDQLEFALYDINNNQFTINKNWFDMDDEKALTPFETSFNNIVQVKQTKDNFVFSNFGFIIIYPIIYNNYINSMSSDKTINIEYDKYTDLGDLVCSSNISSTNLNETSQESDFNGEYIRKYIGESEYFPEMSYVELYENNKAKVSFNNCEGSSVYDATYKIKYDEDLASKMLYITSLSISDGREMEMPSTLMFQMKGNELIVLKGFDGNLFDCSRTTRLIKSN